MQIEKITFSNVEDTIFGNVSGDATIAAGGALTIANDAVEQAMIADDAVGADQLASSAVVNASFASDAKTAISGSIFNFRCRPPVFIRNPAEISSITQMAPLFLAKCRTPSMNSGVGSCPL